MQPDEPTLPATRDGAISEDAATIAAHSRAVSQPPAGGRVPTTIGGYRILGRLGEGAMGIVFEAEQENPRRHVALKVIRGGTLVDDARVRMFQREAATLARLRHPNIAAIYEAGRTEDGEHFFAMELVRGATLDDFLAARKVPLDPGELKYRLRLMLSICHAVHYAHQRGVIHRDLKPANIVVAGATDDSVQSVPEVKILDFGLARITESDLEAGTAMTEVGVIKGTLPYMSPEQARGEGDQIDVRTDVYALGVLLYEMLTGRRPYELPRSSIIEAVRVICEQPATPLSRSWSGVRAPDADLQTIVGKALEKDADRRYGSAEALAEDLQRHLDSRPILARAPSTVYQLRKFAQRNRALVAGVAATLVALVVGIIATTTFGLREAAQRRAAEQAKRDTDAVVEFQAAMLSGVEPERVGRRLVEDLSDRVADARRQSGSGEAAALASRASLRAQLAGINPTDAALRLIDEDILQRSLTAARSQFADRPAIRARLLGSITETYLQLGLYDRAESTIVAAVALFDSVAGPLARETLRAKRQLGSVHVAKFDLERAEPLLRETLASMQRSFGVRDNDVLGAMNDLGLLLTDTDRLAEAESLLRIAAREQRALAGPDDRFTLTTEHNLAWTLTMAAKFAEAESILVPVLAARRRTLGNENMETLQSLNNLAVIYGRTHRYALAEPLYREDFEVSRRRLGDDHPEMLVTMCNLGRVLNASKRFAAAESLMSAAATRSRRILAPDHIGLGIALLGHAEALSGLGRFREAVAPATEAYGILLKLQGPDDPGVQRAAGVIAEADAKLGRTASAAAWQAKAGPSAARR